MGLKLHDESEGGLTSGAYDTPWGRDRARNGPEGWERAIVSAHCTSCAEWAGSAKPRSCAKRAISVILQADYAHLAGLSGKTGSCFTDNCSSIDAKF